MSAHLTYRARDGIVSGVVAGKPIRLSTVGHPGIARFHGWDKVQEIPSGVAVGAIRHKLTIAENAPLETYDWPGAYAQRFDGDDKVGARGMSPDHRRHGRVIWIKAKMKTGLPASGVCLHGPPRCGDPRCIVIAEGWDGLFDALKAARQVSFVVEL